MLRDLKQLCRKLKFTPPNRTIQALRHTFALNYIRRGSQFHLMTILGRTSMEMNHLPFLRSVLGSRLKFNGSDPSQPFSTSCPPFPRTFRCGRLARLLLHLGYQLIEFRQYFSMVFREKASNSRVTNQA